MPKMILILAIESLRLLRASATFSVATLQKRNNRPAARPSVRAFLAKVGFSNKNDAKRAIDECAARFLNDVVQRTFCIVEYSSRMTIHSEDVAMALEGFPEAVDVDGSWYHHSFTPVVAADDGAGYKSGLGWEQDHEEWRKGEHGNAAADEYNSEDEEIIEEAILADEEHEEYMRARDEACDLMTSDDFREYVMKDWLVDWHNTSTPAFDAAYPPVDGNIQLSDRKFCEVVLGPVMHNQKSWLDFAIGDDAIVTTDDSMRALIHEPGIENCHAIDLLKRSLHAFLVAKLSMKDQVKSEKKSKGSLARSVMDSGEDSDATIPLDSLEVIDLTGDDDEGLMYQNNTA